MCKRRAHLHRSGAPRPWYHIHIQLTPRITHALRSLFLSHFPSPRLILKQGVLDFEPARALFVPNEDPLCFYRALARLGQHHLSEQGELYVEINARFGAETVALFEEEGYRKVTLLHDLYQQERFIKAYR